MTDAGVNVLVISSTVYKEIPSEPTVVVVPVFDTEPDTGFGVDLGDGWVGPGLVTNLRKARLSAFRRPWPRTAMLHVIQRLGAYLTDVYFPEIPWTSSATRTLLYAEQTPRQYGRNMQ
jgi:hypothetical protein